MSSIAVYVVTKNVRHLAAWTLDAQRHQNSDIGPTGAWRPICGSRTRSPQETCYPPSFPYEDPALIRRAMARPVCRACLKSLASLTEIGALT